MLKTLEYIFLNFEKAGFNIPVANEFDKTIWDTFKINHPNTKLIEGEITICQKARHTKIS